ncbi:uncharacterized protein LOC142345867 isoform X2 [Convolutriloba macropyga]|uniref:uncharacterized protein LOC142345867 isoform X2 n=1 Tax=Convolutriloba macropyga TaxID=536237 RepID=UPI003F522F3F
MSDSNSSLYFKITVEDSSVSIVKKRIDTQDQRFHSSDHENSKKYDRSDSREEKGDNELNKRAERGVSSYDNLVPNSQGIFPQDRFSHLQTTSTNSTNINISNPNEAEHQQGREAPVNISVVSVKGTKQQTMVPDSSGCFTRASHVSSHMTENSNESNCEQIESAGLPQLTGNMTNSNSNVVISNQVVVESTLRTPASSGDKILLSSAVVTPVDDQFPSSSADATPTSSNKRRRVHFSEFHVSAFYEVNASPMVFKQQMKRRKVSTSLESEYGSGSSDPVDINLQSDKSHENKSAFSNDGSPFPNEKQVLSEYQTMYGQLDVRDNHINGNRISSANSAHIYQLSVPYTGQSGSAISTSHCEILIPRSWMANLDSVSHLSHAKTQIQESLTSEVTTNVGKTPPFNQNEKDSFNANNESREALLLQKNIIFDRFSDQPICELPSDETDVMECNNNSISAPSDVDRNSTCFINETSVSSRVNSAIQNFNNAFNTGSVMSRYRNSNSESISFGQVDEALEMNDYSEFIVSSGGRSSVEGLRDHLKHVSQIVPPKQPFKTENDTLQDSRILCLFLGEGRLGAVFYTSETKVLEFIDDVPEQQPFLQTHSLISGLQPNIVLAKKGGKEFYRSLINLDQPNMVRAAGALLSFLDEQGKTVFGHHVLNFVPSTSTQHQCLVDQQTLKDLRVFCRDFHPSANKSTSSKEGFSLFTFFNRTKTRAGEKLLRHWFCNPLKSPQLINERLTLVEHFVNNFEVTEMLRKELTGILDVYPLLNNLSKRAMTGSQYKSLAKTCRKSRFILSMFSRMVQKQKLPLSPGSSTRETTTISRDSVSNLLDLTKLGEMKSAVRQIEEWVNNTVDWDKVSLNMKLILKSGVDSTVDELIRKYTELPALLKKLVTRELNNFGGYVELCLVYIPSLGFFISATGDQGHLQTQGLASNKLTFVFSSAKENKSYFKDDITRELDLHVGDILVMLKFEEDRILAKLQEAILNYSKELIQLSEFVAYMDCILCMALTAKSCNLVKPQVVETPENDTTNYFVIRGGWNMLVSRMVDQFVSNSVHMGSSSSGGGKGKIHQQASSPNSPQCVPNNNPNRLMLLTGPNASGKSVLLRQTGHILYLAHIGSFVPARRARMTAMDALFVRMTCDTSIKEKLSSFAFHASQVSMAINNSSDRSVVLIDEFARGTSSVDASCLLKSLVDQFIIDNINNQLSQTDHHEWTGSEEAVRKKPFPIMMIATHSLKAVHRIRNSLPLMNHCSDGRDKHSAQQMIRFCRMKIKRVNFNPHPEQGQMDEKASVGKEIEGSSVCSERSHAKPTLVFLFKLEEGVADYSYAEQIIVRNEAPSQLLELMSQFQQQFKASQNPK